MVIFNELRLSEDKSEILVDCFMENLSVYDKMYIDTIYVEYYKNARTDGELSDKAIQIYSNEDKDMEVKAVRAKLSIDKSVIETFGITTFENGLFYVVVQCDGTPGTELFTLPCGYDDTKDVGVVLDWKRMYEIGMQYVAEMNRGCNPCGDWSGFDDFILIWNSLKVAIAACDFKMVEKLWNKFLRHISSNSDTIAVSCGCRK